MIRIPLRDRDGAVRAYALVDDEDEHLAQRRWSMHVAGYAHRKVGKLTLLLHREVLGLVAGDGLQADHRNRDKLDCRRANLRVVTHAQNGQNVGPLTGRFRGVSRSSAGRKGWRARVVVAGVEHYLGTFATEEEAGAAAAAFRADHMPYSEEADDGGRGEDRAAARGGAEGDAGDVLGVVAGADVGAVGAAVAHPARRQAA